MVLWPSALQNFQCKEFHKILIMPIIKLKRQHFWSARIVRIQADIRALEIETFPFNCSVDFNVSLNIIEED